MALHAYTLRLVKQALASRERAFACRRRAAMFSCHDVVASVGDVTEILGDRVRGLPYREDSEQILKWHKAKDVTPGVFDTWSLFKALGWSLTCYDTYAARGGEVIKDLNYPFSPESHGEYDFLFDGVLGQVYNAGQCMRSAMELLAVGGYLLSVSVANSPNHGFYSVSPTFYTDTLAANEFEIVHRAVVTDIARNPVEHGFHPTTGTPLPHGSINVVLARKTSGNPFRYPTQTKFQKSPDSKVN